MSITSQEMFKGIDRLVFNMGNQCNARCIMCFQPEFTAKHNMPKDIYTEKLRSVYPYVKSVKIQGGEPTIMRNCRELVEILRDYPQIRVTLTTNGISVSDFWHETFLAQCGHINFSVNAASESVYNKVVKHGNFNEVVNNIERVTTGRRTVTPTVSISMVVLGENILELAAFIKLGNALGVDRVEFIIDPILTFSHSLSGEKILDEIHRAEEQLKVGHVTVDGLHTLKRHCTRVKSDSVQSPAPTKNICPMPFRTLLVASNGDLKLCCNTWVKIGNLNNKPVADLWKGAKAETFRRRITSNNYLWCEPFCPDNSNPKRISLAHKYLTFLTNDPAGFVRKVMSKAIPRKS
jgi:molybdenum cofactor biosynthesis enzyme MoaA